MPYIQDKLAEFRKLTIELRREHFTIDTGGDGIVEVLPNLEKQAKYNDGIEKFIEQALTDYHNHIIEILNRSIYGCDWCDIEDGKGRYVNEKQLAKNILSLLQDTNPNE